MARRIDDSHAPFKRAGGLGPGPKKRPRVQQERDWECQKRPATKTHYVQVCTYVGDNKARRGKKMTVKRSKKEKKAYNVVFRRFEAKSKRLQAQQKRGAKPGYRCRKTPAARCG